jgi:hypothetical protein
MSSDGPADLPAERQPDPVAEALRMRASDADRERVAGILREAYAEGRLTAVEHEERLSEAYRATTYAELAPVLRDLPVPPGTIAVPTTSGISVTPPPTPSDSVLAVRSDLASQGDNSMVAIFGAFERKGSWVAPPELSAVCVFGGGELDFSNATLTSQETVITAVCLFGGLEITVPHGVVVRSEAFGVFGSAEVPRDASDVEAAAPGGPVLVVKGAAIFGGITVRRPKDRKRWGISRG